MLFSLLTPDSDSTNNLTVILLSSFLSISAFIFDLKGFDILEFLISVTSILSQFMPFSKPCLIPVDSFFTSFLQESRKRMITKWVKKFFSF
ncbi:hypothetical protein [Flavobacterium davisii]|uniref:Uncharacterized protein n=1 Tax=Flavobacterium columnare TaxID=996 RepID=A0A8G0KWC9_9FLAO|nr:hypothetical protein [Flavobacterium davisii]QYS88825.1 hypothetical protein JJC05_15470 [Flavobacterium davisii]